MGDLSCLQSIGLIPIHVEVIFPFAFSNCFEEYSLRESRIIVVSLFLQVLVFKSLRFASLVLYEVSLSLSYIRMPFVIHGFLK